MGMAKCTYLRPFVGGGGGVIVNSVKWSDRAKKLQSRY